MDVLDRFWQKVDKSGDCWVWAASTSRGYGTFRVGDRLVPAHRFSYQTEVGPIPDGLFLDHHCHNRACVNPAHLEPVTHKKNAERLKGPRANSSSGVRGVSWDKEIKKWRVHVRHNSKAHYGGLFTDLAEAEQAAIALREKLFGNDPVRLAS
jgi:hypothetical protein